MDYQQALAYTQRLEREISRYKQSETELEQRSTLLALINGIAREISAFVDLDDLLDRAAYLIHDMFGYHHVALYLLDGDVAVLKAVAGAYGDVLPPDYRLKLSEGIIGQVATYGEKVVVNNTNLEPDYMPITDQTPAMQSELCLPIKMAGNSLGVLDIQSPMLKAFTKNDIDAMETLTSQIAVAVEKAYLYDTIQQELAERKRAERQLEARAFQQAAVANLGQRVLSGVALPALLNEAAQRIVEILDIEYCQILELMPTEDVLLLRAGVGWQSELVGETKVSAEPKFQTGYTLLSSEPVIVEDMSTEKRFSASPLLADYNIVSGMSVIIDGQQWPFGVLGAHSRRRRNFTQDDVNFLQATANVLAQAIERYHAEEALRESEERYRHLVETLFEAIAIYSDNRFIYVNSSGARLYGVETADEMIGKPVTNYLSQQQLEKIEAGACQNGSPLLEDKLTRPDGSRVDVEIAGVTITYQGRPATQIVIRDISERKRAEKALQENEEKYRTLIEKSSDAIFLLFGGRFEIINRKFEELFGVTQEEIRKSDFVFTNIVAPRSRKLVVEAGGGQSAQKISPRYEFTALDKNGNEIEVELTVSYPAYRNGIATQGILRDITDRKRAEEDKRKAYEQVQKYADELAQKIQEVQRQREIATILAEVVASVSLTLATNELLDHILFKLQQLIAYDSAAVFLIKDDNYIVMEAARGFDTDIVNQRFPIKENVLYQQMVDQKSYILIQDTRQDARYQYWSGADKVRSWIGAPLLVAQKMIGYLTVDHFYVNGFTTTDADLVQAFAHQVAQTIHNAQLFTELREAQAQLIQRERLAALGQMAATVAHELRNPLMAIRMGVEYISRGVGENESLQRGADLMQANMERIDRIVEDILYVARAPKPKLAPASLSEILANELVQWEMSVADKNIKITSDIQNNLPPIMLDLHQIARSINNLISNGIDAVGPGGEIKLTLSDEDGYQTLSIADNGPGISPEHQRKIFEPFFTTKSRGTGLGLAIVKQIVHYHHGEIVVWSEVGVGTKFTIKLPQVEEG
jgi:PAS domain S-box-containing protein